MGEHDSAYHANILETGTARDCIREAGMLLDFYVAAQDPDLESITTAQDLLLRSEALILDMVPLPTYTSVVQRMETTLQDTISDVVGLVLDCLPEEVWERVDEDDMVSRIPGQTIAKKFLDVLKEYDELLRR